MTHMRVITLEGPASWIRQTLENSLADGIHQVGKGRKIQVTTAVGDTKEYGKTVTWRAPDPVKEIVGEVE